MEKNKELSLLRGIAIMAVVGIHTLGNATTILQVGKVGWLLFVVSQLLQFAVPCFLFLSAIFITYNKDTIKWGEFYKKKIIRVVIPFLLWTAFYICFNLRIGGITKEDLVTPGKWAIWLLFGKSYTHLYYMSLVIQLYLIAPLVVGLVKGIEKVFKKYDFIAILVVTWIIQMGIYYLNRFYLVDRFPYTSTLIVWYSYVALYGVWVGRNYERFKNGVKKLWFVIWPFAIISAAIFIGFNIMNRLGLKGEDVFNSIGLTYRRTYQTLIRFIFGIIMTIAMLHACILIANKKKEGILQKGIHKIGDYSFGIYFVHPVFTWLMYKLINASYMSETTLSLPKIVGHKLMVTNPLQLAVIVVIGYLLILLISMLIVKIIRKTPLSLPLLGERKIKKTKP